MGDVAAVRMPEMHTPTATRADPVFIAAIAIDIPDVVAQQEVVLILCVLHHCCITRIPFLLVQGYWDRFAFRSVVDFDEARFGATPMHILKYLQGVR